jgi:hypothetical protein
VQEEPQFTVEVVPVMIVPVMIVPVMIIPVMIVLVLDQIKEEIIFQQRFKQFQDQEQIELMIFGLP